MKRIVPSLVDFEGEVFKGGGLLGLEWRPSLKAYNTVLIKIGYSDMLVDSYHAILLNVAFITSAIKNKQKGRPKHT